MFPLASPFTHVKNKETEGSEDDGSDLLPVHRQMVPLSLILQTQDRRGFSVRNTGNITFQFDIFVVSTAKKKKKKTGMSNRMVP